jgi:hypothetical protein
MLLSLSIAPSAVNCNYLRNKDKNKDIQEMLD